MAEGGMSRQVGVEFPSRMSSGKNQRLKHQDQERFWNHRRTGSWQGQQQQEQQAPMDPPPPPVASVVRKRILSNTRLLDPFWAALEPTNAYWNRVKHENHI